MNKLSKPGRPRGAKNAKPTAAEVREAWQTLRKALRNGDVDAARHIIELTGSSK
ncbi:hypothetical protein [uncultured Halomonas sp.]|uniref:hypothetical protein n=1 Tax=uncultured Halomonas sp. TaxID=173971 RepID=UPI002617EB5E|nr:hypothetical protein [uncultured Halomonas sp.]